MYSDYFKFNISLPSTHACTETSYSSLAQRSNNKRFWEMR